MVLRQRLTLPRAASSRSLLGLVLFGLLFAQAYASYGDRLPEFRECVEVCKQENCGSRRAATSIPLLHRLLLWNCPSECDYTCQHIITDQRIESHQAIVQFHGKWPFYRFLGMQEPFSVFFSLLNFLAHQNGLSRITSNIPASYPLRKYYMMLGYLGLTSWTFSMIFHTRDFVATEQLDYFAAGASVLYGLYYTTVRVFRMDQGGKKAQSILRAWTAFCAALYLAHVAYLKLFAWDYTYNIAANVVVGIIQNVLWSWFSYQKFRTSGRAWATLPGVVVVFVLAAMSLELLDFAPVWGCLDAHSLWHLATVAPTMIWYDFLVKDALDDMAGERLKA